jgi:hypothetical protein
VLQSYPALSDNIAQIAVCTSNAGTVGTYCIESKSTGAAITNSYNSRSGTADISSTVNDVDAVRGVIYSIATYSAGTSGTYSSVGYIGYL